jgi:hypothetical protein
MILARVHAAALAGDAHFGPISIRGGASAGPADSQRAGAEELEAVLRRVVIMRPGSTAELSASLQVRRDGLCAAEP